MRATGGATSEVDHKAAFHVPVEIKTSTHVHLRIAMHDPSHRQRGLLNSPLLSASDSLALRVDRPCFNQDRFDFGPSAAHCDVERS